MCAVLGVESLSVEDVDVASCIYLELKKQGRLIADADILIAAQAKSRGYTWKRLQITEPYRLRLILEK